MRVWLGVLLAGCSSVTPFPPSDDVAFIPDGGPDTTLPNEASTFDVVEEDATKFNGGGPFLCVDCTCDGTLNYCVQITGGKTPIIDSGVDAGADASSDGGVSTCDPEASACTQIPIDCLPKPTCDCLMQTYKPPCTCQVDPTGNGLFVTCPP